MTISSVWENKSIYIYYTELGFELAALAVDFTHHLHMLVRSQEKIFIFYYMYQGWFYHSCRAAWRSQNNAGGPQKIVAKLKFPSKKTMRKSWFYKQKQSYCNIINKGGTIIKVTLGHTNL